MLMITEQREGDALTFKLAGTLAGEWATEFERCWREARAAGVQRITVDLADVTFVDDAGKELLSGLIRGGAVMIALDLLIKSIVEELTGESSRA